MFCTKCGKQIADTAKFCPVCGTPTAAGGQNAAPAVNAGAFASGMTGGEMDMKKIAYYLSNIVTALIMLGGLVPVISINIGLNDYISFGKIECNIFKAFSLLGEIDEIGDGVNIFLTMNMIAIIFYLISVILCIRYFNGILKGQRDYVMADQRVAMWLSAIAQVIMVVIVWVVNNQVAKATGDYFGSIEPLSITTMGWIMLVMPIVGLFVLIRYSDGDCHIIEVRSTYADKEKTVDTKEKVCYECGEHYLLGSQCPQCGSTRIRRDGFPD